MTAILRAEHLRKQYRGGDDNPVTVLTDVNLTLGRGESVAVVGASGAGKSTLLHLLGALDAPTGGEVVLDDVAYSTLSDEARDEMRNRRIGFVFQFHHLLREFTAIENVMMPLLIAQLPESHARERATALLEAVDLRERMAHRPAELSGGEQQRCAVARAMVHDPTVLLADEPSGNLDDFHSGQLNDQLFGLVRQTGTSLIVVTHNRALAERADRILRLHNGELEELSHAEVGT
ncbi:MAG: ABC transporter ATP-binding protein [Gemmatimonadales bacterium]|jgi:lipoprotein-releasing system ATP-binding protein